MCYGHNYPVSLHDHRINVTRSVERKIFLYILDISPENFRIYVSVTW